MDVLGPEQSIVCGVDRGEEGARALSMASWLADRTGARLEVIHVAPEPPDRPGRRGARIQDSDLAMERRPSPFPEAVVSWCSAYTSTH